MWIYVFYVDVFHCYQKGPYYRDRVLIRTFLAFWVLIYISWSLFSMFWLHSRGECQFSLHVVGHFLKACPDGQGGPAPGPPW